MATAPQLPGSGVPLVSVLLPVRDAMPFLGDCLASVRRQSLADLEVVAVDDGSRDGSGELLERLAAEDGRFRVEHLPPSGLVAALNRGLELCRGRYVARMDGDDICHPRRCELQVAMLERYAEVGVVSCLVRHFPWRQVGLGTVLYEGWLNRLTDHRQMWRERFVECPVAHPSATLRRGLLEDAGGYRDMGWPEDYDLWLRLLERGVRFAKVERHLVFLREHEQRLTRRDPRYAVREFVRAKAHFLLRGPLARRAPVVIWGAGVTGRRLATHLRDGGAQLIGFVDIDPRKIGRRTRDAEIHGVEWLAGLRPGSAVVLAAVSSRGARQLIRRRLVALGWEEGEDFWCVA